MSEKETTTMEVLVHKANIALAQGESLNQFTNRLSAAAREHVMYKLNIAKGKGGAWMVEAFSDTVVMSAYKAEDATKYYAFKYSRDKDMKFEFGNTVEVERITMFKPKANLLVSKSKENKEDEFGGNRTRKVLGEPLVCGGWKETSKSFWMGVI